MKIAIVGASAGVGLATTNWALERGHEVATLSRRIETLPDSPRLRRVRGSSTNPADVATVVRDAEAVIVTLGTGTSAKATTLYSESGRVLLGALAASRLSPTLIVLTGFGAGESWDFLAFPMTLIFRFMLKTVYADKSVLERVVTGGYPRWEIVRPGRLTNGPATGRYRVLVELTKGMKVGSISRADVAQFLVTQAESPTYLGKYPALGA